MAEKILIAYATKCGSTAEVAEAVGEELASRGLDVDVRPTAQVDHVAEYDAVVVGCPILYASPHSDAIGLLHRHRAVLARLPVAYFLTCLDLTRIPGASHRGVPVVVDPDLGPRRGRGSSATGSGHTWSRGLSTNCWMQHRTSRRSASASSAAGCCTRT